MKNYELNVVQSMTYFDLNKKSFFVIIVISCLIFLIVNYSSSWGYGLFLSSLFALYQYVTIISQHKYFINSIQFKNDDVKIDFIEKSIQRSVIGKSEDFHFEKKIALKKTRTVFLIIYFKNEIIIKQYENNDWTESLMDELIFNTI
jgi:hypothetical protein